MPNTLNIAFNIDQPAAPVEFSKDSGTNWSALTLPTTGTAKSVSLTSFQAGTYAAGQLGLRPTGYPAKAVYNTVAVTVTGTAPTQTMTATSSTPS